MYPREGVPQITLLGAAPPAAETGGGGSGRLVCTGARLLSTGAEEGGVRRRPGLVGRDVFVQKALEFC